MVDFTNGAAPTMLSRKTYTGVAYSHQGWITDDHKYIFLDDELDESRGTAGNDGRARTYIWDVTDLDNPINYEYYTNTRTSIDHNLYVKGKYIYEANYESGLRILEYDDSTGIPDLKEVAYFDTYPSRDGVSFNGAWSNYPYFDNFIAVQDINRGLFLLDATNLDQEKRRSKVEYYKNLRKQEMENLTV